MQFSRIDPTLAIAKSNVSVFNSIFDLDTAGYLQGMTDSDLLKVVNWRFAPMVCEPINITATASVCFGATYEFNGIEYSESGSYTDTLTSVNGCDSVVTLVLTVNEQLTSAMNESICFGSTFEFNGIEYSESGSYTDTLTSVNGCDSVVTLVLTMNEQLTSTTNESICFGSSYEFNGNLYTEAGSYTDTLVAENGCDSLVTLVLTVNTVVANATFADGMLSAAPSDAAYQWINCATNTAIAGATSQNFQPTENGSYAVVVTSQNECSDTSACVVINDLGLNDLSSKVAVNVSPNPGNGQFDVIASEQITKVVVKNVSGQVVTEMTPANETCVIDIRTHANGVYFVNVITANTQKVVKVIKK